VGKVKFNKGFTLVELMIALAVLALLSSIAYPIYNNQAQKARRADAKSALPLIALAQERYYTANGKYGSTLASLSLDSSTLSSGYTEQGYYGLLLSVSVDGQQFDLMAQTSTGTGQGGDSKCTSFSLNQLGAQSATGSDSSNCW